MTCIVGIEHNGKVYIGGDSQGTNGYLNKVIRSDEKVFIKDEFIFGFAGSYRMGQILRYCLTIPEQTKKQDDYEFLCSDFITAVTKAFKDGGFLETKDGVNKGGFFLLGYRGKLYNVQSDFQVARSYDPYDAIGCGQDFAMGSIYQSILQETDSPENIITMALDASCHFSAGVGSPYTVLTL